MKTKRPKLITILCIIGFASAIVSLIASIATLFLPIPNPFGQEIPIWHSIIGIVLGISYMISLTFIWKMRRLGLILYTVLIALSYAINLLISAVKLNIFFIISLSLTIMFLVLFYAKFRLMD